MDLFASYTFHDDIQRPIRRTENLYSKVHKLAFESRDTVAGQKALENLLESVVDDIDYQGSKRSKKLLYQAGIVTLERRNRVRTTPAMDDILCHSVLLREDNPNWYGPMVHSPLAEINLFSGVHDMPVFRTNNRVGMYGLQNGSIAPILPAENIFAKIYAISQQSGGMRVLECLLDYIDRAITARELTNELGRHASKYLVKEKLAKRHRDGYLRITEIESDMIESSLVYLTNGRETRLRVQCPVTEIHLPAGTDHISILRVPDQKRPPL